MGENIHAFLLENNISSRLSSIHEVNASDMSMADYVFLGCWTSGLLLIGQKPEKIWVDFAKNIPNLSRSKVALFTTYKIRTGSMFKNMKKHLDLSGNTSEALEMKSRNGNVPEPLKHAVARFL
jgi:hypothetical protein